ncbi:DUF1989 domain-containing protein [Flexivirga alba]|jgi:Uncharacterized conserved protein|uniref:DUF1989 domain-containing protein n=1 Tax=Flexivirga alba TaxID=702742 RepID=A0ABW2AKE3_9MICO
MQRIPPQTGLGIRLRAGDRLVVVDPNGGQVSDLFCVAGDGGGDWLSSGRTIDYGNTMYFSSGDTLYSNLSRPMLTIEEDTCGRHDFLLTPCSQATFDLLYPDFGGAPHPSCFDNLCAALGPLGVEPGTISTTFNIFMNVWFDAGGTMHIDPPTSDAGDRFVVRAQMDLLVGVTACSAEKSNGGVCKPIDVEVISKSSAPE